MQTILKTKILPGNIALMYIIYVSLAFVCHLLYENTHNIHINTLKKLYTWLYTFVIDSISSSLETEVQMPREARQVANTRKMSQI